MMDQSDSIANLAAAMAQAQAKMENATLNKTNPHFRSRYADLAAIRDAVIPPLTEHGIAVWQVVGTTDNGLPCLHTTLAHNSGEFVRSTYVLPSQVKNQQEFGSALTYARRYSLAALCGVSAEEDDDGNADAEGAKDRPAQTQPAKQAKPNGGGDGQKYDLVNADGAVIHSFARSREGAAEAVAALEQYAENDMAIVAANQAFLEKCTKVNGDIGNRGRRLLDMIAAEKEPA
jgi:hypothetical protein